MLFRRRSLIQSARMTFGMAFGRLLACCSHGARTAMVSNWCTQIPFSTLRSVCIRRVPGQPVSQPTVHRVCVCVQSGSDWRPGGRLHNPSEQRIPALDTTSVFQSVCLPASIIGPIVIRITCVWTSVASPERETISKSLLNLDGSASMLRARSRIGPHTRPPIALDRHPPRRAVCVRRSPVGLSPSRLVKWQSAENCI